MLYDKRTFKFTAKQWFPELDTSDPPLKFIYDTCFSKFFQKHLFSQKSKFSLPINVLRSTAFFI